MRQNPVDEVGIEARDWLQDFCPAARVSPHCLPLSGSEPVGILDYVGNRAVDLPDVVEQRDSLDAATLMGLQVGCLAQNQGIRRHAPNMLSCFSIVRFDRIQESLQRRGSEPFNPPSDAALANE